MEPNGLPQSVTALCNAKINLFLRVKARRSDGFHEIETIYHSISLADIVTVTPSKTGLSVSCDDHAVPRDDSNLAVRAAAMALGEALPQAAAGPSGAAGVRGLHIDIAKRVPMGAGLGGGSADAAGSLVAVDRLFGLGLTASKLERLAEAIGSDVKFMVRGGCAIGRGRGEELEWLPALPPLPIVVVVPELTISTAWAYESLKMELTREDTHLTMMADALRKEDVAGLCDLLENDFERLVFGRFPIVKRIKDELIGLGARGALMSGSGSSVYGIFSETGDAKATGEVLVRHGLKVFVASLAVRGVTTPR